MRSNVGVKRGLGDWRIFELMIKQVNNNDMMARPLFVGYWGLELCSALRADLHRIF